MRRVLFVLLLLVVGVVALGFYRGWWSFATSRPQTGPQEVKLKVDKERMKKDVQKVKQKITGSAAQVRDKTAEK
jgi:hypothetical protein